MKLQLAELTLEKQDGNEQTVVQRLKVRRMSRSYQSIPSDYCRNYDLSYMNPNMYCPGMGKYVAKHMRTLHTVINGERYSLIRTSFLNLALITLAF